MKTSKLLLFFAATLFLHISSNAQNWSLTGNSGTDTSVNFIGTTDAHALAIKINNQLAGYLDYDLYQGNTSFGYQTLFSTTSIGKQNTAFGYQALYSTTGGGNVAVGHQTLSSNTSGYGNTSIGRLSLYKNTTGAGNTANGYSALGNNYTGNNNTASGIFSLYFNKTGYSNVAVGVNALYKNISGHNLVAIGDSALYNLNEDSAGASANTAIGSKSLYTNTKGLLNTADGFKTLYLTSTGEGNTGVGAYCLYQNKTGRYNTAIGYNAGPSNTKGSFTNTTALGYNAIPTASNQVRIGNTSVTSIGGQVNWTVFSDERVKTDIKENVPGLTFIKQLRPVTYHYNESKENELLGVQNRNNENNNNTEVEKISFTGLIAQEVDKAAQKINYNFSGVDKTGAIMGLRYSEFVVPLIKSVQELSQQNENMKKEYDEKINNMQKQIDALSLLIANKTTSNNQITNLSSASISQNFPNPFSRKTNINYSLPEKFSNAQIIITAENGAVIRSVKINGIGKGTLNIDAATLSSGTYNYSLIIDGKLIDTKKMMLNN